MFIVLFFKLLDIWRVLKPVNWKIIRQTTYTDGTLYTEYYYNGRKYIHVGPYPPRNSGFSLPISHASRQGKDITDIVKVFSGPLANNCPSPGYIFYKTIYRIRVKVHMFGIRLYLGRNIEKGADEQIVIKNILGHYSLLGAK